MVREDHTLQSLSAGWSTLSHSVTVPVFILHGCLLPRASLCLSLSLTVSLSVSLSVSFSVHWSVPLYTFPFMRWLLKTSLGCPHCASAHCYVAAELCAEIWLPHTCSVSGEGLEGSAQYSQMEVGLECPPVQALKTHPHPLFLKTYQLLL